MAAFPSTPILDSGAGIAQSPMPDGNPWLPGVYSPGFPNCDRDGAGNFSTTDVDGAGSRWPTIFAADMQVYAQLTAQIGSNDQLALWFGSTVQNRGYAIRYYNPAGTRLIELESILGGVPSTIFGPTTLTLSIGDWFGAQRIGSTITAFTKRGAGDWNQIGQTASVATTGASKIGMEIFNNAGGAPAGKLANFGGGEIFLGDMGQSAELGRGAVR
jgi:hypothetical protein